MRKVLNFFTYVDLFEADQTEDSKLYDQTLGLILSTILNSYTSELAYPSKSYDSKIEGDINFVRNKAALEKPEAFKRILANVKSSSESNTSEGVKEIVEAWEKAGNKAADALKALISQYKDDTQEVEFINGFINQELEDYLKNLGDSVTNESKDKIEGSELNEAFSFWRGKKSIVEELATKLAVATAKLSNFKEVAGMESVISSLQNELTQLASRIGQLQQSKRKEISKEELDQINGKIDSIIGRAEESSVKLAKQDKTNQVAAGVLVQALALVASAKKLEQELAMKMEDVKKEKIKMTISGTIDYDPSNTAKFNKEVQDFQKLVTDKFSNIKSITSLPQWKKMGIDGKFGPNTRDIVRILKGGFELEDKTGDITKELVDEIQIQADTIKESMEVRIIGFDSFPLLAEGFNVEKAVQVAQSLAQTKTPSSSGKMGSISAGKSASQKAGSTQFSKDFRSQSASDKWKWLSDTLKNEKYSGRATKIAEDTYNNKKVWRIFWDPKKLSRGGRPFLSVLFYPADGANGKYIDYMFDNNMVGGEVERGTWAKSSDPSSPIAWDSATETIIPPMPIKQLADIAIKIMKVKEGSGKELFNIIKSIPSAADYAIINDLVKATPASRKSAESAGASFKDTSSNYGGIPKKIVDVLDAERKDDRDLIKNMVVFAKGKKIPLYFKDVNKYISDSDLKFS